MKRATGRIRQGGSTLAADVAWCAAWVLLSRLVLLAVGVSARLVMQDKLGFDYVWTYADALWLDIWGVWDTGWYLDIARHGYDAVPKAEGPVAGQANWAFFPLFPVFAAGLSAVTGLGAFPALLLIANVAFLGAVALLFHETRHLFGRPAARAAVALLCVMPASYVWSSAYTESLFLLFLLGALALARRGAWIAAGCVGAAAALTRNLGVLLVLPFAMLGWPALRAALGESLRPVASTARRLGTDPNARRVLVALVLPPLGLLGFMILLWVKAGNPFAFLVIQDAWARDLGNPLMALLAPVLEPQAMSARNWANWLVAVAGLLLTGWMLGRRQWVLGVLALALILVPLTAGLESVLRYMLVVFPAIMAAGALLGDRPRLMALVLSLLALVNGFLMTCWAVGLPNVI